MTKKKYVYKFFGATCSTTILTFVNIPLFVTELLWLRQIVTDAMLAGVKLAHAEAE